MTAKTNQQGAPEALRLAESLERRTTIWADKCFAAFELRRLHAENERLAALVDAQQAATHVQNPAEIEHVAGDVSKNGAESNMAQQPAPSEQQPFGWIKQSEIDSSNDFGGSINLWRRKYDCDVPVYLAPQPAPSAAGVVNPDPHAELRKTWQPGQRWQARSFRNGQWGPWTDAVASEPFWFPHQDYRRHPDDLGPQPSPTPQADSQPAPTNTRQIAECYGDCPTDPKTCANPCKFEGRAARAPAESVLEDAERLDWLALAGPVSICVVMDRRHDGEVEVSTDDVTGYGKTLREALDAARKQGGKP